MARMLETATYDNVMTHELLRNIKAAREYAKDENNRPHLREISTKIANEMQSIVDLRREATR